MDTVLGSPAIKEEASRDGEGTWDHGREAIFGFGDAAVAQSELGYKSIGGSAHNAHAGEHADANAEVGKSDVGGGEGVGAPEDAC
jgi:hypothetical protein